MKRFEIKRNGTELRFNVTRTWSIGIFYEPIIKKNEKYNSLCFGNIEYWHSDDEKDDYAKAWMIAIMNIVLSVAKWKTPIVD